MCLTWVQSHHHVGRVLLQLLLLCRRPQVGRQEVFVRPVTRGQEEFTRRPDVGMLTPFLRLGGTWEQPPSVTLLSPGQVQVYSLLLVSHLLLCWFRLRFP